MIKVRLYWNHICVLHNQEKKFLEQLKGRLTEKEIDLEVTFFGLGYPEHMSDYLRRKDAILPDMIVSADLVVFEDSRIFGKYEKDLYSAADWSSLKEGPALEAVWKSEKMLPFLSIPLVYFTGSIEGCSRKTVNEIQGLSFGGINNSAGKTLVKAVWSRYGKEQARELLRNAQISDMPIGAFNEVRNGLSETALVPSLYAMRADEVKKFQCLPEEGPLLIPSFLCARNTIPAETARRIALEIIGREMCDFYEDSGNLLFYPAHAWGNRWQEEQNYFTPNSSWFEDIKPEEFYELYGAMIPGVYGF